MQSRVFLSLEYPKKVHIFLIFLFLHHLCILIQGRNETALQVPQTDIVQPNNTTQGNVFGKGKLYTNICVNTALNKMWLLEDSSEHFSQTMTCNSKY